MSKDKKVSLWGKMVCYTDDQSKMWPALVTRERQVEKKDMPIVDLCVFIAGMHSPAYGVNSIAYGPGVKQYRLIENDPMTLLEEMVNETVPEKKPGENDAQEPQGDSNQEKGAEGVDNSLFG